MDAATVRLFTHSCLYMTRLEDDAPAPSSKKHHTPYRWPYMWYAQTFSELIVKPISCLYVMRLKDDAPAPASKTQYALAVALYVVRTTIFRGHCQTD